MELKPSTESVLGLAGTMRTASLWSVIVLLAERGLKEGSSVQRSGSRYQPEGLRAHKVRGQGELGEESTGIVAA